jgi:hypothetical protein
MNEVFAAAAEIQSFLRSKQWAFCIIGGLALARWGQPRTTADVDITLLTGFGTEEPFIDDLLEKFTARRSKAKEFALQNRVLLLQASNGVGIDIAMAALPFEEHITKRATEFDFGRGVSLLTASGEDMVVLKAFAGRPQDWIDVEGIIVRQGSALDWKQILEELGPLCELKESPETVDRLIQLRDQLAAD